MATSTASFAADPRATMRSAPPDQERLRRLLDTLKPNKKYKPVTFQEAMKGLTTLASPTYSRDLQNERQWITAALDEMVKGRMEPEEAGRLAAEFSRHIHEDGAELCECLGCGLTLSRKLREWERCCPMCEKNSWREVSKTPLSEMTPGTRRALLRPWTPDKASRVCTSCDMVIPPYPGRYPKYCPDCGSELQKPVQEVRLQRAAIGLAVEVSRREGLLSEEVKGFREQNFLTEAYAVLVEDVPAPPSFVANAEQALAELFGARSRVEQRPEDAKPSREMMQEFLDHAIVVVTRAAMQPETRSKLREEIESKRRVSQAFARLDEGDPLNLLKTATTSMTRLIIEMEKSAEYDPALDKVLMVLSEVIRSVQQNPTPSEIRSGGTLLRGIFFGA